MRARRHGKRARAIARWRAKKGVGGRWARGQGLSECEVGERAGRKNEVKDEVHGRDAYGGGRQGCELEKFKERRQEKEQGTSASNKQGKMRGHGL